MIRKFRIEDFDNMLDLAKDYALEAGDGIGAIKIDNVLELAKELNIQPGYQTFVSEHEGKPTGGVVCQAINNKWNNKKTGHIMFLFVHPDYRNGFTAKNLLGRAEAWFRELDCELMTTSVQGWHSDYTANKEFIDQGHSFYGKLMTHCGHTYVKEIK